MKNTANIITALRIPFAVFMLLVPPFSAAFWICYLCAGLSDILDGLAARRLKQESALGAKLDSAADLVFACAIAAVMVLYVPLPLWLWVCAALIALLRSISCAIGYIKYHSFFAVHTCANKAAGALLFAFPLLYTALGLQLGGALVCAVAFLSALEELLITASPSEPDRDRKSLLMLTQLSRESHEAPRKPR